MHVAYLTGIVFEEEPQTMGGFHEGLEVVGGGEVGDYAEKNLGRD